jgi:hypothetical protein
MTAPFNVLEDCVESNLNSTVKVGSVIKSLDFNGNSSCFMIGEVTTIDEDYIYCDTLSVTFSDKQVESFDPKFRTLKQGLLFTDNDSSHSNNPMT